VIGKKVRKDLICLAQGTQRARRKRVLTVDQTSPPSVWDQTSPPTVWANNAGEFSRRYSPGVKKTSVSPRLIRRYSPVVCVQRIVGTPVVCVQRIAGHGVQPNVAAHGVGPNVAAHCRGE